MEVGAVVRHHFACHTGSSRLGGGLFNNPTVWSLVMVLLLPVVLMVNSEANPISLEATDNQIRNFSTHRLRCSTIGMLAILSALSYIWTWKMDDDPNGLRSTIVSDSRTPSACHPERSSPYLPCRANRYLLHDDSNSRIRKKTAYRYKTPRQCRYSASSPYVMVFPVLRGT
jgi:hypothetical protein